MVAIEIAQRAAQRRAQTVRLELSRGLPGLATIAATAAFFGLLLTCWGMANAFPGGSFTHSSMLAAIMNRLAGSLFFNAWGLALAVFAAAGHRMLSTRLEVFDVEMTLAVSLLPDALRDFRFR